MSAGVALSVSMTALAAAQDELELAVRDHAQFVFRVAYSVLRDHHEAEDAAQETFLRMVRNRKRMSDVRDVRAWLARVAYRVALDRAQQKRRATAVPLDDAAADVRALHAAGLGAEQIAAERQMSELMSRLIAALPPDLRDAVTLSTVEEMTAAEVAAVLDIPEATVRTRMMRVRQLLRDKLSNILEGRHGA
jgi:RNA polymerase sigma-70 factor (ECF subfamily)